MAKAPSSSLTLYHARTVSSILLLGEVMPSPYSCCAKEGLVCVALASPTA